MHWFFILLIITLLSIGGWSFLIWQKIGQSIAVSKPLIASAESYEQHPLNPTMRVLVAGDSIGVGVGSTNNVDSLAGRIGRDLSQADITNIAVSGSRLVDLEKTLSEHGGTDYDLILLTIGANDITHTTSLIDMQKTLARVLDRADLMGGKIILLSAGNVGLCPAFLWPFSEYISWRAREVRKIFMAEALKHPGTAYVDLFNERKNELFNTDIPRYYAPDLFHPSGEGYGIWYTTLKNQL